MWCHLPTSIGRRRSLRFIAVALMVVAFITTLIFANVSHAAPGTSKTINFQGRLMTAAGAVVADGHYNMQFKIYQGGAGTAAGNPGGTLNWTENYINNGGTGGVEVRNGFFSVSLGSLTPFGTSVDWNQDILFLSMNIAGSAAACTTFGSAPCAADGEMLPMKQITATPYSLNSGAVGGKTADDLVQLGQGTQTDGSNNSSIAINKTGTGNLIELQASGKSSFTVNTAGSIAMGSTADQSITVATSESGGGKSLTVSAGSSASSGSQAGGDVVLQGGAGNGLASSGRVVVKANTTDSTGTFQVQNTAGDAVFTVDTANSTIATGTLKLSAGSGTGMGAAVSLWDNDAVSGTAYNDGSPVNLGVTFKSDQPGYVSAVKFYNPAGGNVGGVGKLWACNDVACNLAAGGTTLATASFANDTSAGWKTATFSSPVYITANTHYIATYFSPNGIYYAAPDYFSADFANTPLHAPNGFAVPNGSYNAGGSANFPTNSSGSQSNYWVDINFQAATNVDQINTTNDLVISSAGAMTVGPTGDASLKLQGSGIDISATNGGNITMQGGAASVSNGNGGSITLSGGAGNGTGARGLVVLNTPTFATTTNDPNCYTGGAVVLASCTISTATINNSAAAIIGFGAAGQTATLPDPTITTAGRILYITAAGDSQEFTLQANAGDAAEQTVKMRPNTTTTLLWNGTDWTIAGGTSTATLQDVYNNTPQDAASAAINLTNTTGSLTIHDSSTDPVKSGTLLGVSGAADDSLFSVNNKAVNSTEYVADGGAHDGSTFATHWTRVGASTVTHLTTDGREGGDSAQVNTTTAPNDGVRNILDGQPAGSTTYTISLYAKLISGSPFTDLLIRYSPDQGSSFVSCANYSTRTITTSGWTRITCDLTTSAATPTVPYINITQPSAPGTARVFLVDDLSMTHTTSNTANVKVGAGNGTGDTTLFILDKSATAPTASDSGALLGSMYYDTTIGKVQCYEAAGWGACGDKPDIFVTLSPEYSNAVMNGADIGTVSSDLCSDTLNINDGSNGQPTICGTDETYNFYNWTSSETTNQTRSIYVTYQLPSSFKQFAAESTSLIGKTDSTNAGVSYQIYRDSKNSGLVACGSAINVSTGPQTTWQTATAGSADPSNCNFEAGDSVLFRVNLTAKNGANAYVSNLGFIFSNN